MAKKKAKSAGHSPRLKKREISLIVSLIVLILGAASYGTYYLLEENAKRKAQEQSSASSSQTVSSLVSSSSAPAVSSNVSSASSSALTSSAVTSGVSASSSSVGSSSADSQTSDGIKYGVNYSGFSINFLELGVYNAGDSIFIKAGDNDILIDAGANYNSTATIESYIDQHCTDGKLEYVIATHSHTDHIAGMSGGSSKNGILYKYSIGTIIDFAETKATTAVYNNYETAVSYAVGQGAVHYTAAQCFDQTGGAKREYSLGTDLTMDILYNKYYYEISYDSGSSNVNENNHSVCTMFNFGSHHFLLTGDLEADGETALAAYYDGSTAEKTLPQVDLFKAGHHGSYTASNEALLAKIQPKVCCVCCCAGGSEYTNNEDNTFPSQAFINRIAKYTSSVFVTSQVDEDASRSAGSMVFKSMNGNITVSSDGANVGVNATNNLTKLKDSTWFNETVYLLSGKICSAAKKTDFYTSATSGASARVRRTWPSYGV
jgi:beta-lactamase superfamily II metal-dependent hydrolase